LWLLALNESHKEQQVQKENSFVFAAVANQ